MACNYLGYTSDTNYFSVRTVEGFEPSKSAYAYSTVTMSCCLSSDGSTLYQAVDENDVNRCSEYHGIGCVKNCENWCRYFKDAGIIIQWPCLILQVKTRLFILSLDGTTCIVSLSSVELTDVFRKR